MGKFTTQILTDEEFDNLPYAGISDSLGIADKAKGLVFVRESGLGKDFDRATLMHEIDHLVEKNSTHEDEYGIRHKKVFEDIIAPYVLPVVGSLLGGPLLGGLTGLGSTASGAVAGGLSKVAADLGTGKSFDPLGTVISTVGGGILGKGASSGIAASKAAGGGLLGQTLSGAKSALGIAPGVASTPIAGLQGPVTSAQSSLGYTNLSQVPQNLLGSNAATALANTAKGGYMQTVGSVSPYGTYGNPSIPGSSVISSSLPKDVLNSAINLGMTASKTPQAVPQEVAPSTVGNISKKAGELLSEPKNILGLGSNLLATTIKQPEFQMPASVEAIRSKLLSGGSLTEQGALAKAELSNILKSTPQELYPTANDAYYNAALRRTRQSYEDAKKNLDAQYNLAGVYGSGEHLAAVAKLQEQLTNAEADLYAQTEQRNFELARTAKYQALQDSLGVDKDVMDDLVGLSGLDVQTAAMAYGARVEDVQTIREALGTIGSELLSRGKVQGQTQQSI